MIDWDAAVLAPMMAVFGESQKISYTRAAGGVPFAVDGIFDDAFYALVMSADGEPEIATAEPVIGVRAAQFAGIDPVQSDTLTVPRVGRTFVVTSVEPDGKGHILLRLGRKLP